MTQAFLNEPTIEAARERYLKRWHLDSVKSAWNGRKPTLAQFKKRFEKDYERRQNFLAKKNGGAVALAELHASEQSREVIENGLVALLENMQGEAEPEVENLGSDGEPSSKILEILARRKQTVPAKADKVEEPKFVKPENFDELPRSGQVYFFLHRAQESNMSYAIVPLKRGVAAEAISQIKDDGRSYVSVANDLVVAL